MDEMNKVYTLNEALLIYKSHSGYFFQIHDVLEEKEKGELFLGAGKPLSREAMETLCRSILPTMVGNLTFFEEKVLASSGTIHGPEIWWAPPAVRPIFFTGQIKLKSGHAPWPGLVLVAQHFSLSVYAVKGTRRPTPDTPLFVAPFFNMTGSSICLGNAKEVERNNAYEQWEAALFNSAFSEDRPDETRLAGSMNLKEFWRGLILRKETQFPEKQLLRNNSPSTVGELIEALRKGKET